MASPGASLIAGKLSEYNAEEQELSAEDSTEEFMCHDTSVLFWSAEKRKWCCAQEEKGCQLFWKAQPIGFAINTFPETAYAERNGTAEGSSPTNEVYIGNLNATADVLARFNLMKEAIEKTKGEADLDSSPSTLKIFMAQEFFFRGQEGAYNVEDLYECLKDGVDSCEDPAVVILFEKMYEFASEDRWSDWLFVFGTVIAQQRNSSKVDDQYNVNSTEVYDLAPVIWGGPHAQGFVVGKTYISQIDFIQCTLLRKESTGGACQIITQGKYSAVPDAIKKRVEPRWRILENNIFDVGGVFVGLEICADHIDRVLATQLKQDGVFPDGGVQVQLMPTGGMNVYYAVVPDGAPVFLQDGAQYWGTDYGMKPALTEVLHGSALLRGAAWNFTSDLPPRQNRLPDIRTKLANKMLQPKQVIGAFGEDWEQHIEGYFDIEGQFGKGSDMGLEPKLKIYEPIDIPPSGRFAA